MTVKVVAQIRRVFVVDTLSASEERKRLARELAKILPDEEKRLAEEGLIEFDE